MEEQRMKNMMIKEAAKELGVESHVLRYWEDELGLEIKRNTMGHRYYDERDIMLFNKIKELKENGLSLKDIKQAIIKQKNKNCMKETSVESVESKVRTESGMSKGENRANDKLTDKTSSEVIMQAEKEQAEGINIVDFKQAQLQAVMNKVVANALRENKDIITTSIKSEITADVMRQFDTVMREKEEKEEARFRKIDEYLRQLQAVNEEVAATKSRRLFGKRK